MTLIVIAFILACIGLAWQVIDAERAAHKRRDDKIAECAARGHYWEYVSAYDEGKYWHKRCPHCPIPAQHLRIEDVPDEDLVACRRRNEERNRKRKLVSR